MNKTVHTQENPLGYKSIPELLRALPSQHHRNGGELPLQYRGPDLHRTGGWLSGKCGHQCGLSSHHDLSCHRSSHRYRQRLSFSLHLGAGEKDKARRVVGNGISMMVVFGVVYAVLIECSCIPFCLPSGPHRCMPYARLYKDHSAGHALPHRDQRHEQPGQGGRQPQIFHDMHAHRGRGQHHPGPAVHLLFTGAWRALPGPRSSVRSAPLWPLCGI